MSNAEGWGSLACASRGFDYEGELQLIKLFYVIAVLLCVITYMVMIRSSLH